MRTYIDSHIEEKIKRGCIMLNPYTPGAGTQPNFLAGRDDTIDKITNYINGLLEGGNARHCIFYGVRGVGKTVLLNKLEDIVAQKEILYSHIECGDHDSLIRNIIVSSKEFIEELDFSERVKSKLKSVFQMFSVSYSFTDNSMTIKPNEETLISNDLSHDLTKLFINMGEMAKELRHPICFFIDEIQSANRKEMSALIAAIHRVNQKRLPILVIGAGLPTILRVSGEAKSYSERLFEFIEISSLNDKNANAAIIEPALIHNVKYSNSALKKIIKHTGGYPYFIQEFGYCIWEKFITDAKSFSGELRISESDVDRVYPDFVEKLDISFFGARFNRATKKEKEFLFAMLKCSRFPCPTSLIAKFMNKTQSAISPLRNQLLNKGLIYAPSLGEVDFTVPHFDRYLNRLTKES